MNYPTTLKLLPLETGIEVLCEVLHPMHNGEDGNSAGSAVNFITQVVFRLNGSIRAEVFLGKYVSRHPVIGTVFGEATSGDKVNVSWQDIAGNRGQASATVQ